MSRIIKDFEARNLECEELKGRMHIMLGETQKMLIDLEHLTIIIEGKDQEIEKKSILISKMEKEI